MRTAITLVALLVLTACNPPSNQFLNEVTTTVTENSGTDGGTDPADVAAPELVPDLPTPAAGNDCSRVGS